MSWTLRVLSTAPAPKICERAAVAKPSSADEVGARYSVIWMGAEGFQPHSQHEHRGPRRGTGEVIGSKSVDMRGNTDKSWSRALDWLVDRYLLAPGAGGASE